MGISELELVEWLSARKQSLPELRLGIGDDMAVIDVPGGRVLMSSDMLLDGVHFDTQRHDPRRIGRKAIACGLSDCAAMAVRPVAANVSVALSTGTNADFVQELFEGIFGIAREYDLAISGGDTTSWTHPLAIDVSMVAVPHEGIEPVTRSGARAGDVLCVTGPLGGSLLDHHLCFVPRVGEARVLAEHLGDRLHAMMDISDGLSLDVWRMCRASGAGAILDERQLETVVSDDAKRMAEKDGVSPLDHAMSDGEDFELLLAVGPGDGDRGGEVDEMIGDVVRLYPVGMMTESGLAYRRGDGNIERLEPKGYVH